MQYVRLYVNEAGDVEHVETSTRPLPETPAIQVHTAADPQGASPIQVRHLDCVKMEFEADDQQFRRARHLREDIVCHGQTLAPSLKAQGKLKGKMSKIQVIRATRGQANRG